MRTTRLSCHLYGTTRKKRTCETKPYYIPALRRNNEMENLANIGNTLNVYIARPISARGRSDDFCLNGRLDVSNDGPAA